MTRNITIEILVLCSYSLSAATPGRPNTVTKSDEASLDNMRQSTFDDLKQARLADAVASYEKLLRTSEILNVPADRLADDLHSMGLLYSDAGRYEDAEKTFQRELDLLAASDRQSASGRVYLALGGVLQLEGAFSAAENSYKNAIDVFERYAGPKDPQTAAALNGLGWLYTLWGKMDQADQLLQKARNLAEKSMAPDDPGLIRFLDTNASFLTMTGKYSEAEKLWKRAVDIGESAYIGQEGKFDEVFLHLGQLYGILRDYGSAENMFQRFLAVDKQMVRTDASVRAVVTAELARIYTDQHKFADAESLFNKSMALLQSERDKVPLSYSLVQSYLGDYYMERSRWRDAEEQYRSALKLRTAMLGQNATDVATSMFSLSKALGKLHRKKEAEQYLAQALSIVASQKNGFSPDATVDIRAFREK